LIQRQLVMDFLEDKQDLVESARTIEAQHAVIWCVNYLVPLTQFRPGDLTVVSYEHLCSQPGTELARAFAAIRQDYRPSTLRRLDRPSRTTRPESTRTRVDRLGQWKKELSIRQVETVPSVVRGFGLGHIYGDSLAPLSAI
jgi:hypothetical protein